MLYDTGNPKPVLCDNLEGCNGDRGKREVHVCPALAGRFFTTEPPGKEVMYQVNLNKNKDDILFSNKYWMKFHTFLIQMKSK